MIGIELEIDRDDTETPRTDRAAFTANFGGSVVVDADFARQLEIELADAMAKLRWLGEKI